jgi:hypothetical protein
MAKRTINGWVEMTTELPQTIVDAIIASNGFKYGDGSYCGGFVKGDDFIIITPDGGYYKVNASYSVWYKIGDTVRMQCIWSMAALKRTLKSLKTEGKTVPDPGYTT